MIQVIAPTTIWPTTVAGWVALVGVIASPFVFAFTAGRIYAKLNGYGGRLADVESMLKEHAGAMIEIRTAMQNILGAQEALAMKIGEATRNAQTCNDGTEAMGKRLEALIEDLKTKVTGWERETALELRGLTVELKARGLIDVPPSGVFTHGRRSDGGEAR